MLLLLQNLFASEQCKTYVTELSKLLLLLSCWRRLALVCRASNFVARCNGRTQHHPCDFCRSCVPPSTLPLRTLKWISYCCARMQLLSIALARCGTELLCVCGQAGSTRLLWPSRNSRVRCTKRAHARPLAARLPCTLLHSPVCLQRLLAN
jgi:hypothetical protein